MLCAWLGQALGQSRACFSSVFNGLLPGKGRRSKSSASESNAEAKAASGMKERVNCPLAPEKTATRDEEEKNTTAWTRFQCGKLSGTVTFGWQRTDIRGVGSRGGGERKTYQTRNGSKGNPGNVLAQRQGQGDWERKIPLLLANI